MNEKIKNILINFPINLIKIVDTHNFIETNAHPFEYECIDCNSNLRDILLYGENQSAYTPISCNDNIIKKIIE